MTALLLRGVDLAAFAVAMVARLRAGGVQVASSGPADFVAALRCSAPTSRTRLYWTARLTLVDRADDLEPFDRVFAAVFADAVLGLDPVSLRPGPAGATVPDAGTPAGGQGRGTGVPWITRPVAVAPPGHGPGPALALPDPLPSPFAGNADQPFDTFDAEDLRLLAAWLEQAVTSWPQRRSMRARIHSHGRRVDLRETTRRSRATGWEPVAPIRTRSRLRTRPVVLVCDVSRSMAPYATVYLHLLRAAALRRAGVRTEVFACATTLTRLTAVLGHRSPEVALQRANAAVVDRYGGTHLGRSLAALVSGPRGNVLRGAVVVVASDGWDSDPPEVLDRALVRLKRRARALVWLNPRAAQSGFAPLTGAMAAALPHCDLFLPAHSLTGLRELFTALARL